MSNPSCLSLDGGFSDSVMKHVGVLYGTFFMNQWYATIKICKGLSLIKSRHFLNSGLVNPVTLK